MNESAHILRKKETKLSLSLSLSQSFSSLFSLLSSNHSFFLSNKKNCIPIWAYRERKLELSTNKEQHISLSLSLALSVIVKSLSLSLSSVKLQGLFADFVVNYSLCFCLSLSLCFFYFFCLVAQRNAKLYWCEWFFTGFDRILFPKISVWIVIVWSLVG